MNNQIKKDFTFLKNAWLFTAVVSLLAGTTLIPIPLTVALLIYEFKHPENSERYILYYATGTLAWSVFEIAAVLLITLTGYDTVEGRPVWIAAMFTPGLIWSVTVLVFYIPLQRKKYLTEKVEFLVLNAHIVSLQKISVILGKNYFKVRKAAKLLIKNGVFQNARIDDNARELVFEKSVWARQHVVCENCGAELFVNFGETLTCEYCGSKLKVRRIKRDSATL